MKKERWRGLIIAGAILLIGLGYEAYQSYLRNLPQDYTIGIIKKVGPAAKGGDVISYISHPWSVSPQTTPIDNELKSQTVYPFFMIPCR